MTYFLCKTNDNIFKIMYIYIYIYIYTYKIRKTLKFLEEEKLYIEYIEQMIFVSISYEVKSKTV